MLTLTRYVVTENLKRKGGQRYKNAGRTAAIAGQAVLPADIRAFCSISEPAEKASDDRSGQAGFLYGYRVRSGGRDDAVYRLP